MDSPTCIIHLPEGQPDAAIIWLHGLGADAHDLEPISSQLRIDGVRHLFPNAPRRPVTVNNGTEMRAWYDLTSLDFSSGINEQQLQESIKKVNDLIETQIEEGISAERILLAGFSQGGVVALLTALTGEHRLGGVIALSTYLPEKYRTGIRNQTPVLHCHGLEDTVIPYDIGLETSDWLKTRMDDYEWRTYPDDHGVSETEIAEISEWTRRHLADSLTT